MPKPVTQLREQFAEGARVEARISSARTRAALAVSRELLCLYWSIGRDNVGRQGRDRYGAAVVERLASDLAAAFTGVKGFAARNLWRMRVFGLAHPASQVLPQLVAELGEPEPHVPWQTVHRSFTTYRRGSGGVQRPSRAKRT